ncbi:MAG TPA: arsenate reductase (azurin) small subunit [Usitatibacter sp.]|nr:arsenate reductase (azurin) small subunit [Usitatibacter sp.]
MAAEDKDCPDTRSRLSRREFIKIGSAATLASGLAPALAASAAATTNPETFPVANVADLASLKVDTPVTFTYPDESSPAVLVRLPHAAVGGVGPGNSIVAYSMLCTHKGCPVSYKPERKMLICPCHWSSFDPAKAGQMVIGQGSQALPQIGLRVQGNTIQAVSIEGLIYGRHANIL